MIRPQFLLDLSAELIVDNFAGGGGASTGIELALGRHVDIAINHDPQALSMHSANHPQTFHIPEDVFHVDPLKVTQGRPVGLAWFSPDCKHFSKAKGGKPRSKKIRGLAWVVLRWVDKLMEQHETGPRVIVLENVEEFVTWGPLLKDGTPNPKKKGATFRSFIGALRRRGYVVEWRELRACDYGAPTIRKRFFLIARCDGVPITWPAPTHGSPDRAEVKARKLKPWRTAAECIDWSITCPSIFTRKRPLAEATLRRIAKGIMRYVVNSKDPFIVPLTHQDTSDRVTQFGEPLPTVTGANRGELAIVAPVLTEHANASGQRTFATNEPLRTQCAQVKGGHFALIAPVLAETAHGETAPNGSKRWGSGTQTTQRPLNTVAAGGGNTALVSAFLAQHNNHQGKIPSTGRDATEPMSTVTTTGSQQGLVTGCLVPRYGERPGQEPRALDIKKPAPTIVPTANGGSLVAAHLTKLRGTSIAQAVDTPLHTVSAGGTHFAEVRAFLIKYFGTDQDPRLGEPMHTCTTKDRFGLVTVAGQDYEIADIGLRMLTPRELFRAQGFPDSYIIGDDSYQGLMLTKTAQVRMCGNAVCPPLAAAIVRANLPELSLLTRAERKQVTA